jgi:two-component system NarL family response regulator
MTIRVMLADDHRMFREALRAALVHVADLEIVAEASTGAETIATAERIAPDVLVLDVALPDINGIEVARRLEEAGQPIRVVALSGYADRIFVQEMLQAGARGYVVKSSGTAVLIDAIRAVAAGQGFLSPEVTSAVLRRVRCGPSNALPPVSVLSDREQQILRLLAEGASSNEIGARLSISPDTVKVHRRNIKRKLGVKSAAELIRYAIREGLHSA